MFIIHMIREGGASYCMENSVHKNGLPEVSKPTTCSITEESGDPLAWNLAFRVYTKAGLRLGQSILPGRLLCG